MRAGIQNGNVDRADPGLDVANDGRDPWRLGDIEGKGVNFAGQAHGLGLQRGKVSFCSRARRNSAAFRCAFERERTAYPLAGAGNPNGAVTRRRQRVVIR